MTPTTRDMLRRYQDHIDRFPSAESSAVYAFAEWLETQPSQEVALLRDHVAQLKKALEESKRAADRYHEQRNTNYEKLETECRRANGLQGALLEEKGRSERLSRVAKLDAELLQKERAERANEFQKEVSDAGKLVLGLAKRFAEERDEARRACEKMRTEREQVVAARRRLEAALRTPAEEIWSAISVQHPSEIALRDLMSAMSELRRRAGM
jgi:hypothetical protein